MAKDGAAKLELRAAILDSAGELTLKADAIVNRLPVTCCETIVYRDRRGFLAAAARRRPHLVLAEFALARPPEDLLELTAQNPRCVTILFKPRPRTSCKIAAMQAGAHEVIDSLGAVQDMSDIVAGHLCALRTASGAEPASAGHDAPHGKGALALDRYRFDRADAGRRRTRQTREAGQSLRRFDIVEPLWAQERRIIESALEIFDGNIARAADALQINPSTIYRKRQYWAERLEKEGAVATGRSSAHISRH